MISWDQTQQAHSAQLFPDNIICNWFAFFVMGVLSLCLEHLLLSKKFKTECIVLNILTFYAVINSALFINVNMFLT